MDASALFQLIAVGSTAGIVAQFLILVPYLRAAGIRFRPRFDWRGVGLGHTLHLGVWTILFVIVNQIAYVVVVRLASSGTACAPDGTGITVYSNVMLVVMVPHSIITVSLATAILPRLSAAAATQDMRRLAATLGSTLRTAPGSSRPVAALGWMVAPWPARTAAISSDSPSTSASTVGARRRRANAVSMSARSPWLPDGRINGRRVSSASRTCGPGGMPGRPGAPMT